MKVIAEEGAVPIKMWTEGIEIEAAAMAQLRQVARLPFLHSHVAVMPDCHAGYGSTVGTVFATKEAVVPAAVGVDIGCGMEAIRLWETVAELPSPSVMRAAIEKAVPHGRTNDGKEGDRGAWTHPPIEVWNAWGRLREDYDYITEPCEAIRHKWPVEQLGTLGTGNHFIEVCLDEMGHPWVMLHSGSRGAGNRIGAYFAKVAAEMCEKWYAKPPHRELAWLAEGTEECSAYITAVLWAQKYAAINREVMLAAVLKALGSKTPIDGRVSCHHNYLAVERHFGETVLVTRKGAVRAQEGDWGIIPGSMGAKSYITLGKGCRDSFNSCSHGAGRAMSRTAARVRFTVADHEAATEGVECRKDEAVLDETPGAYKDIEMVMAAQSELVEVKRTLKQIVCVKG